jgi:restriction system protein
MIVLADSLKGDGPAKILVEALLRGIVLVWPLWVFLGALATVSIIYGVVIRVFRHRRLARSGIADIDQFGGKMFEEYLGVLFQRLGYKVERTKFVGDFGGDLVLSKDGVRTVVQAKRWTKSVGVKAVQEVVAAKGYYDCDKSMVVSNSRYTKQAQELARKNKVQLWDRDMLIRQLNATGAREQVQHSEAAEASNSTSTTSVAAPQVSAASEEHPLATVAACQQCAKVLSSGERTYCETNAKRFGGQMLCFRHQRTNRT